jgi:uncharacterized membrane protein
MTASNIDESSSFSATHSIGNRLADAITGFGGSWTFIAGSIFFLLLWIVCNTWLPASEAFDPYPFIFLNLVLSMIAALQAPLIMMSQNRQLERDRAAAEHDYEINLEAEIEIKELHEKLNALRQEDILRLQVEVANVIATLALIEEALRKFPSLDGSATGERKAS